MLQAALTASLLLVYGEGTDRHRNGDTADEQVGRGVLFSPTLGLASDS
jgi:hypothetical protein